MDRLKRETGTAVMFITHDMAVVAQMADRVVVMFRGNKVEEGTVEEIFENPSIPIPKRSWQRCRNWAKCAAKQRRNR